MDVIKNEELKLEDIPQFLEDSIVYFAHSFDGYEFGGSFEKCSEISQKVRDAIDENKTEQLTLSELRTCLFFYYRALRHGGGDPDKSFVDKLLGLIRDKVMKEEFE